MKKWFLLLTAFVFGIHPCLAQDSDDYASLWIEKSGQVQPEAVRETLADLERQQEDPEQIIVFIHGFKKPREGSTRDFNALAQRVRDRFDDDSTRVGLVGVQWDSSITVTKTSGLGMIKMLKAYHEAIPLARSVGRGPTRQLLLALQDKYPKAHISVFAHSMGCEVAAAAVLPEMTYDRFPPFGETYKPERHVQLDTLVLAGSDLDYDFWYKSKLSARNLEKRTRLAWLTVADYLTEGDKVLNTRKKVRGKAGGSSFPRMTLEQLDQTVAERRIFIDQTEIPRDHQFLSYYDDGRLGRILSALRYLTTPRAPEPDEIAELDEILVAPDDMEVLLNYLDHPSYSAKFYALWRIERENCGDARHMTDLTLDNITDLLKTDPKAILEQRADSPCITVQKGQFPSKKALTEAGAFE
jgi:hypothetical protein